MRRRRSVCTIVCGLLVVAFGCERTAGPAAPSEPLVVPIRQPVRREVTDFVDFIGRTDAVHSVDVRPRVTGYLVDMPFREGAEVKQNDVLFVVDPRPYQAQLDQAQGQVDLYKASRRLARANLARDRAIDAASAGSVSLQQFDQDQALVNEADARLKAYEKTMELYQLNYDFTRVVSQIDGQVSRYYLTRGNLVNADQTLLTTVVSVDPIYAAFEMDTDTLLRSRREGKERTGKPLTDSTKRRVLMGLQGEDGFPHEGTINFEDNKVNRTTGSIMVRGVFANPRPPGGRRLLSPGMFVRIRLPIGQPHPAVLISNRAVLSDQGLKFVYVLDAENKAQYRRVTVGALEKDDLRVIEQGLNGDEWVAVGALQQVRPRMSVKPERVRGETQVRSQRSGAARKLPTAPVSQPVQRQVTDYVDFTGRTDAVYSVDIRPRVTGYLVDMPFKEGAEVKQGELLFVVDPRPYQSQLEQAQRQVDLYRASLRLARTNLARDRGINALQANAVTQQQLDQDQATVDEADARLKAYEKAMELYQLNYDFTKVLSPIDGKISSYYLTRGNLVNQDQTLLTTVVSVDPMYAFFEVDEPTLLRTRKAINAGKVKLPADNSMGPVFMGLEGEEGFPHEGKINFVDNRVNPTTGSIMVRGVFPNPMRPSGHRLLSPGMFVRIRQPIGQPHQAVLVIDRAISADQRSKFVYVLDAESTIQRCDITTGALQEDGLRVIEQGLTGEEWVVVGGLQQVREKDEVAKPERVPMPTLAPQPATPETPPPAIEKATPPAEHRKAAAPVELPKSGSPGEPRKAAPPAARTLPSSAAVKR